MASAPSCVNQGGAQSLIRLDRVPQRDAPAALGEAALQALACWQARSGEILTVVDPLQTAYRARIVSLAPESAACVPFEQLPAPVESPLRIDVYQALPEKERFELVLQKLTEIGVSRIGPMESQRSTTLAERDALQQKSHRWPEVLRRAARQCRRAMLPELLSIQSFAETLASAADAEVKLMLYEGEAGWTFREGLGALHPQHVALLIGPEGGFAAGEVAQARDAGFLPVRLGPRILRTETAAIVAAALLQSSLGDLR